MAVCRIFLVDDHSLFRGGLRGLLERNGDYKVVGEAASGEEFLTKLPDAKPDVVFMDYSMEGMNGDETTERALTLMPELNVITLSMYGEQSYYSRMVAVGAKGFLLKDSDINEVVQAIEIVRNGGSYFSPQLLSSITDNMRGVERTTLDEDALSSRETEILIAVCQGYSNQEIAERLFISKRTVDKHRANILEKTGCKNTASLVVYAIKNALVEF